MSAEELSVAQTKPPHDARALLQFKRNVQAIPFLPSLPAIAAEVMRAVNSPRSSANQLSAVISRDPALTGRILRMANSAFYGMPRQVDSLDFGIVVMGMAKVRDLALSLSITRALAKVRQCGDFTGAHFWEHSAACSAIARAVAAGIALNVGHDAFMGGLLHDMGKILLANYYHDQFEESMMLAAAERIPWRVAEERVLGVDHALIGSWLAERWNLPEKFVDVIRWHHDVAGAPRESLALTCICHVADLLAHARGFGVHETASATSLEEDPAWHSLCKIAPAADNLDMERIFADLEVEIREIQDILDINRPDEGPNA